MILQALHDYYQRKTTEPGSDLAPFGFEWKELPFIIELDSTGKLIQIEDTRESEGRKKVAKSFMVPQGVKKTSGVASNLLWDNAEYVLGLDTRDKPDRVIQQHQAFIKKLESLPEIAKQDTGLKSVLLFLENLDLSALESLTVWNELLINPNLSFRLQHDLDLVCQRPDVIDALQQEQTGSSDGKCICLITGDKQKTTRLHTAIKGVWGAQTSGANIVSFNLDAFDSYGKSQGNNAPVGERPAFAYTTALNHLLRKKSPQRMQVGDASTVFWTEKPTALETAVVDIFGEPPKDDPDRNSRAVQSLFKSIDAGLLSSDEGKARFYVLGLAPNAARIAVRFWQVATVAKMAGRIRQHFSDLAIIHSEKQPPYLPLFRLLVSTATQGKADNIPPNLAGEVMRCILAGLPYPQTLLSAAVRRNRAEQEITYPRAALIKACINRSTRYANSEVKEELNMSLDSNNDNSGYRLGRLFAVLEKIQEEANPGINATIRDRYYGAASSSPVSVFSTLLKLKNHHLSKLDNKGRVINLERLIGQIMEQINDFPKTLNLQDQGRFAIGYYHQRQDFYTKKPKSTEQGEQE
jgi:CRISPR-associated protein Csd1